MGRHFGISARDDIPSIFESDSKWREAAIIAFLVLLLSGATALGVATYFLANALFGAG